jgi:hypothetical protein
LRLELPRELLWAIIGALIITLLGFSHALLKHPPYAPAVKAEQQSNSGLQAHKGDNAEGQPKAEHGEEEGTEFWPPVFGYRLKVTDTLVAVFTALLFFATLALWLSTRALVRGAEDTAERQLRAYVFLDSIDLPRLNIHGTHTMQRRIKIAWKNFGGTRTRRFIARVSHDVLDLSTQPLETFDFHDEPNAQTFSGLIGPSQSVNPPLIPVCDVHLVGDDDTALLIWGWAEYQDVFNDTIHRTEFGFRVWIEGDISANCLIWFEPTEKHNAADEDCMKPPMSAAALAANPFP